MSTNYTNFNNTNCSKSSCSQRNKLCPDHSCKNYHCHQPPGPETPRDLETYQHPLAIETPRSASIPVSGRHSHFEMVHVNDDNISNHLFQTLPVSDSAVHPTYLSHSVLATTSHGRYQYPFSTDDAPETHGSNVHFSKSYGYKRHCKSQTSAFLKPPKHCIIYKGPCFDLHVFYLILTTTAPRV